MDVLSEIEALLVRARRGGKPRRIRAAIERVITEELPRLRQPDKARSHIEAVRRFAGNRLLTEISQIAWDYRAAHPHLSTATCNRRIAWLRRIARLAHRRWGWLARPIYVSLEAEHNTRHRYLTLGEVKRLLVACEHRLTHDAVLLAVYTAAREGEIFGLDQTNVRGNCLWLPDSKNREPRLIPILPPMREAVSRLPLPCKARTMYGHYQRACRRAGLENLTFHDLRHTTASLLVNAGHSIKVVQEVLGHRSVQAANRYAHLSVETKRAALEGVFGA